MQVVFVVIKNCIVCGKEFDAKGSAKTCSPECSKINYREKTKLYNRQWYKDNRVHYREYQKKYQKEYRKHHIRYQKRDIVCDDYNNARASVANLADMKCEITGLKGEVCHHLDSWHWCEEKRADITNLIWISESVHKLFHSIYGNRNNTYEQFAEFVHNSYGVDLDKVMQKHQDW